MRFIRIVRKGDAPQGQDKASALCVGAHGAGNNSQCDCVLTLFESTLSTNTKTKKIMTKKEELTQAVKMAVAIKSVAESLRRDARDYDVRFPLQHAERLERMANDFLKAVRP